jgi:hypothetical protein
MKQPKAPKEDFSIETILKNPVDARTLKGFIDEAIIIKTKIQLENSGLADIRTEAKDKLGIPPGMLNHLVNTKFKESLVAERNKLETTDTALVSLYGEDGGVTANFGDSNEDIDGDE